MGVQARHPHQPGVTLITGSLSQLGGGMFYSARIPANRLVQQGFRIEVHGLADDMWPKAEPLWHVSSIAAHPVVGPARIGLSPHMLRAARPDTDLVHLRGLWTFPSVVASTLRVAGQPLVVSPEGMLHPWALKRSTLKKRIATWLFEGANIREATVLHALNELEAEDIRRYGYTGPIAVIPNGVELTPRISPAPVLTKRRTLLFIGRIHPKKGLAELIAAWSEAIKQDPGLASKWQLDIVGWDDGGHRRELERQVKENGLMAQIRFLGELYGHDKEQAMRDASAFILPSHGEGHPISALEAWSFSLPILMTAECNLPEGFRLGAASEIHLDGRFSGELATWLQLPPTTLRKMGERGREIVEQRYDWASLAADFADLYRWVAGYGERPACVRLD